MIDLLFTYKELFLQGAWLTLKINALALVIGIPLAIVLFAGRTSESIITRTSSIIIIEAIKGVPALVMMFWVYLCFPLIADFRPTAEVAAIFALAINYGGNASEVFRSTWSAVSRDLQLGLKLNGTPRTAAATFFEIPFLIGATMPGLLAQLAATIKLSAVAAFIGVPEIFHATQGAIQQTYRPVESYTFLALFYLILVLIISATEAAIRKRFGRPIEGE
jgi:polar amino acid transport system permease protein